VGISLLNPHAEVPGSALAYHQGGFYELVVALVMLAVIGPLRHRFRQPTMLLWTVVAMYGVGRFVIFFWRSDTGGFGLGLNAAQATSIALVAVAAGGAWAARRRAVKRALALP
jgi:prolipoprotein diacylglyceryltransferase